MRDAADLRLDEAIVHVLNPRRDQGVVLSHGTIPLAQNPRVVEYLVSHVERSLRDQTARAARFVEETADAPFGVCGDLLAGKVDIVAGSRRLAERLCDLIAGDRRIATGDLVVCRFRAGNHPDVPFYLGLLKLDPSEMFRHSLAQDDAGNEYVTLELEADALPTAGERLQKCAFVRPLDPRPSGYDMMLLDRQIGADEGQQVAKFFVNRFLGAGLAYGPAEQTKAFNRCVVNALNRAREDGTLVLADEEAVRVAIDHALQTPSIDTVVWVDGLPGSADLRTRLRQALVNDLPDQRIEVDAKIASSIVRKKRFRGAHGLKVEVEADQYADVITSVEPPRNDQTVGRWRITIETETWEEFSR